MVTMTQRHLQWLLVALSILLFVPSAIAIASMVLSAANESAGWLRYKLPEVFFWMFLTTGLASPFVGISILVLLWAQWHQWAVIFDSKVERRLKIALILISTAAVIAPAAWIYLFSEVFFVAGGNR